MHFDQDSGNSYFLSTSRGQMMIYATLPELDAIEVLLRPMRGTPLIGRIYILPPDSLANAANSLAPEISSVLATNPAAGFRVLLESFDPTDPRPKQVHYNPESRVIFARATEGDLDKLESVVKILLVTNSEVLFRSKSASSDPVDLSTRTFMVGPVEMARALGRVGPVQVTNAAAMVQELLIKAGVDLKPPKTVVFKDSLGLLMVRATVAELDTIEKFLVQANQAAASGKLSPGNPGEAKAMIPVPKANPAGSVEENPTNLLLRVYKVDAKAMVKALDVALGNNVGSGTKSTNDSRTLLPDIRKLFASLGVDLRPPKTVFFNEPKGQLLVRATQEDLDTIESGGASAERSATAGEHQGENGSSSRTFARSGSIVCKTRFARRQCPSVHIQNSKYFRHPD